MSVFIVLSDQFFLWLSCRVINVGKAISLFPFQKVLCSFSKIFGIFKYLILKDVALLYTVVAAASDCIVLKYSTIR